jgi:hypothetical protein
MVVPCVNLVMAGEVACFLGLDRIVRADTHALWFAGMA